jgi:hypothetical protein
MLKFRDGLTLDINFNKTSLFVSEGKVIDKTGMLFSFEDFFNYAEGVYFASENDCSLLLTTFLSSLYKTPIEPIFDCLVNNIRTVGLIRDRRYFDVQLKMTTSNSVSIKNPPFEYLYGDYLAGGSHPNFLLEVENICCNHFIYMNCGALSALLTSSFALGDCISDSAENILKDVIQKPKSIISILNDSHLKILHDEKVPIVNHKVDDPLETSNYLLGTYGSDYLKDLWSRFIGKRLPAFIYRKNKGFLDEIFDQRVIAIKNRDYSEFLESELGLRFSIYYSNTKEFRDRYNRSLIKFFHSTSTWKIK